jgi:hypothetical protein
VTGAPENPSPPDDPRPQPPHEPDADDCCQSGCDPCIYDLYWDAVDRYERAFEAWRLKHEK